MEYLGFIGWCQANLPDFRRDIQANEFYYVGGLRFTDPASAHNAAYAVGADVDCGGESEVYFIGDVAIGGFDAKKREYYLTPSPELEAAKLQMAVEFFNWCHENVIGFYRTGGVEESECRCYRGATYLGGLEFCETTGEPQSCEIAWSATFDQLLRMMNAYDSAMTDPRFDSCCWSTKAYPQMQQLVEKACVWLRGYAAKYKGDGLLIRASFEGEPIGGYKAGEGYFATNSRAFLCVSRMMAVVS